MRAERCLDGEWDKREGGKREGGLGATFRGSRPHRVARVTEGAADMQQKAHRVTTDTTEQ